MGLNFFNCSWMIFSLENWAKLSVLFNRQIANVSYNFGFTIFLLGRKCSDLTFCQSFFLAMISVGCLPFFGVCSKFFLSGWVPLIQRHHSLLLSIFDHFRVFSGWLIQKCLDESGNIKASVDFLIHCNKDKKNLTMASNHYSFYWEPLSFTLVRISNTFSK